MNLTSILEKTKSSYIAISNAKGEVIDSIQKDNYSFKKEFDLGSNFFFKLGTDFFKDVLKEDDLTEINMSSKDSNVLFIKNKTNLVFSFYSKSELSVNIIKLIIDKYEAN